MRAICVQGISGWEPSISAGNALRLRRSPAAGYAPRRILARQIVPFRAWWIPDTALKPLRPNPGQLLKYLFTLDAWDREDGANPIGSVWVTVFRRQYPAGAAPPSPPPPAAPPADTAPSAAPPQAAGTKASS